MIFSVISGPALILGAVGAAMLAGIALLFLVLGLGRAASTTTEFEEFQRSIEEINKSELEKDKKDEDFVDEKTWTGYWYKLVTSSGATPATYEQPARFVMIGMAIAGAVGLLIWPRDILGLLIFPVVIPVFVRAYFQSVAKKRTNTLNKQLPLLIAGLRANLQANQTPQSALMTVAEDLPSPLKDEMIILRGELDLAVPVNDALDHLAQRVPSRDIQFLISAIKIAITSGTDLDKQLKIIESIVASRTKLQQKLASAIASVTPTIWVSAITIPAMFLFQFFSSPDTKSYWFTLQGVALLGVVAMLYVGGLIISKKMVNGVEKA